MDTWKKLMCLILISYRRRGPRFPDRRRSWGRLLQGSTSNDLRTGLFPNRWRVLSRSTQDLREWGMNRNRWHVGKSMEENSVQVGSFWATHAADATAPAGSYPADTLCFSTLQVDREKLRIVSLKMQKIRTEVGTLRNLLVKLLNASHTYMHVSLVRSVSGDCSHAFNIFQRSDFWRNASECKDNFTFHEMFLIWFSLTTIGSKFLSLSLLLHSSKPLFCPKDSPAPLRDLRRPLYIQVHFLRFHSQRFTIIKQLFESLVVGKFIVSLVFVYLFFISY